MAKPDSDFPLKRSSFACLQCPGEGGPGAPFLFKALREDLLRNDKNEYTADCPQCGNICGELWYMGNLRKGQGKQTGPRSEAGKKKASANGYTTGRSYIFGRLPKVLPPAKPGKYAECDTCQDYDDCVDDVKRAKGTCRPVPCHRQSEVFAKYRAAHLTGDPEALRMVAADNQAQQQLHVNACDKVVHKEGVLIESFVVSDGKVVHYVNDKGKSSPLVEKKMNPAINEVTKMREKMGFGLADWTLTPKSKEAKEALKGFLAGQAVGKGQNMDEFISEYNKKMENFEAALARGNKRVEGDAIKLEAEAEEQETPGIV